MGDGTYSLCVKCYSIEDGEEYAVKIIKLDHDSSQEFEALEMCQGHKNVVKLIEKISDKKFTYIVCELLDGGELFNRIRHYGCLSEPLARLYFKQIVDVVSFMHSKSIVHRDLKPENFVFESEEADSVLKLLDFGFACHETSDETPPCFTLDYAAPESLVRSPTKFTRDLWALGVILYTMLCGNTPFKPTNKDQDERNFRIQITENIRKAFYNINNERWSHISREAKDLIGSLLIVNEADRLSLKELKTHPWMRVIDDYKNTKVEAVEMKAIHRAESEDTVVNDDIDIADSESEDNVIVKINDDDDDDGITQLPKNREQTRSNDDSSSGIVMSERNEGSSSVSSHHDGEMEENVVQVFDECEDIKKEHILAKTEVMQENHQEFIAEQEEPENLSMKEVVLPESSEADNDKNELPIDKKESLKTNKKSKTIKRNIPKHRKKKITKKKTDDRVKEEEKEVVSYNSAENKVDDENETKNLVKMDLPRIISGDIEEKFKGYDDNLVDGYPNIGFMDQKEDLCLILFGNLLNKSNEKPQQDNSKVLQVKKPTRRGRRKQSVPALPTVQSKKTTARIENAKTEPIRKRGRKRLDDIKCEVETQNSNITLVDTNINHGIEKRTRLRRKCADDKVIRYDQIIITVDSNPKPKRTRKNPVEVKQIAPVIKEEVVSRKRVRKRKNEGTTEQKQHPPQKRRKIDENKIINIKAEKNPRPNITEYTIPAYPSYVYQTPVQFSRKGFIKTESHYSPIVTIQHQDQSSARFYISNYVDNKDRNSMIQCTIKTPVSCGIKNEKFEKSPIKQYGVIPSRRMPRRH